MSHLSVWLTGNSEEGYTVQFSDSNLNSRLSFWAKYHKQTLAHIDYMQRNKEFSDYNLFDSSDKHS